MALRTESVEHTEKAGEGVPTSEPSETLVILRVLWGRAETDITTDRVIRGDLNAHKDNVCVDFELDHTFSHTRYKAVRLRYKR